MTERYMSSDPDAMIKMIKRLNDEDNAIDLRIIDKSAYQVSWTKNKKIKNEAGEEINDEVWVKNDGSIIVCQDLELEHARNIIRMLQRAKR